MAPDPTSDPVHDLAGAASHDTAVAVPLAPGMGRRRFLTVAAGTAGAVCATAYLRPGWLVGTAHAAEVAAPSTSNVLVVLFLRGGADGLSLLAPVGDPTYPVQRPDIAVPARAALPVDATFGLHPAAPNLKRLLDDGRLAVVPAAGSPNPTRSHFEAQDLIEKGTPTNAMTVDGWLGRYLRASATTPAATLRGYSSGPGLPASTRGATVVASPDLSSLRLQSTERWASSTAQMSTALAAMYASGASVLRAPAASGLDLVTAVGSVVDDAEPPADWPSGFGPALWPIAKLVSAGLPVEVATADLGGWDTHEEMGSATDRNGRMSKLVADLDASLGAFFGALGPAADRVTVVVMSEFGRRIAQNGSGGLDHGHGQVMLVAGGGVSPGVKGAWVPLTDTDDGDVRVLNDYRLVLAEVLARRMRPVDMSLVFPGFDAGAPRWLGVTA